MKKRIVALILAAVMGASLTACGGGTGESGSGNSSSQKSNTESSAETSTGTTDGETFKIGVFQPLSGASAAYGIEARNAIEMAVDYVNENGGFNGVPGEVVAYDTQCSVEEAVKIASKLVNEERVDAVLGSLLSSEMFATGNTLNEAGVYTIGLGTSASWMQEDWPYVFRASMNNGAGSPTIAKMIQDMNCTQAAVFYGQDDAALSAYSLFEEAVTAEGIEILLAETYDQGDTDFSAQITNIVNSGAEVVFMSTIGETAPIVAKQLRQYGYDGVIISKESFMASQIAIAGEENSNYIAFVNPYVTYESIDDIDIPEVKEFAEKYAERYGEINKTDSSYRGWDSVMVMWEASKIAKSNDSEALKEATNQISDLQGLGGTLDFTKGNREGYNEFNSFILIDGKNVLWSKWMNEGGYEDYLAATGRDK